MYHIDSAKEKTNILIVESRDYRFKACRRCKPLAQILLLDQGRSMKPKLDTGVEVCDNKMKKKQRHTTNEKPNMYIID